MLASLSQLITRHWIAVIAVWLVLLVGLRIAAPRWDDITHDGDMAYFPDGMPTVEAETLRAVAFPEQKAKSQIVVVLARKDRALDDTDLDFAEAISDGLAVTGHQFDALEVWDPDTETLGKKLVSRDRRAALVVMQLPHEFGAVKNIEIVERVQATIDDVRARIEQPAGLELGLTGSAAIGGDLLSAAKESIRNTEVTTVVLVLAILLAVYRAPLLILVPLITIGVSLGVALALVSLLTQLHLLPGLEWWNFKIFTTTKIFVVVILFGAGTDFCLFLISRYREELELGHDRAIASARAVRGVAGALIGSALTTVLGLATMFFAEFGKFSNSGPAIALCLTVALLASLTLSPALLRCFGSWIFWPSKLRSPTANAASSTDSLSGFWDWTGRQILARPAAILAVSLLVLLPIAWSGWSVGVTYDLLNELAAERPSRIGTNLLLEHFPAGETGPVTILVHDDDGEFNAQTGRENIADLTAELVALPGIEEVRSLSQPFGEPPAPSILSFRQIAERVSTRAQAVYLSSAPEWEGRVTRIDLLLAVDPFDAEAIELLDRIERKLADVAATPDSPWYGAQFHLLGTTAATRDLRDVTESDRWRIQQLVVISVLAVLLVLVRRPMTCVYLILSVLLSYYVTLGISEWVFAWSYGDTYHGLDWKVPIFLFVILVAVGQDYNIYLITRVLEEQEQHGPQRGLRIAVARTGGIITSCGVIMAGTFISMMTGTMRGVKELGFALALGIMLDTLVVRPILVPAFIALLDRHRKETVDP